MLNRRRFIAQAVLSAGACFLSPALLKEMEQEARSYRLTVLHTNDVHSRLDPFPMDGSRNQGLGGVAARAALIEKIRAEEQHTMLLDAGDIFQGTPYFNLYKGEPEIKAMTAMNYDATTIGNHDFDAGLENLANQLTRHARFPMLVCNYDFRGTPMEYTYRPYEIFRRGKLKIGVLGVGIEMKKLIEDKLIAGTQYLDPVQKANETAAYLKKEKKCDLVICLSHLGFQYRENKISDWLLAEQTENIDLILGGHTHTFLSAPIIRRNKKGQEVVINQVGYAGIILGRLDLDLSGFSNRKLSRAAAITVTKNTG